jgi:hypothetical protein
VQRSAAKQAGQKSGDGGIPRSGGAGDALDRERGTPQLAVGPTGQVDRHGSARIGQALGAAGAEVVPAMPALQRRHARPHREEGTGHFGTLGFADVVEQFRTALGLFAGEELLRVHHEKRLFHAGQEDVDVRQNPFENSRPRSLARRAVRIGQSHVQRRGRPGGLGPAEDLGQFRAVVGVEPAHQRGISQVKQPGPRHQGVIDIVAAEAIIGPRCVQKDTVDARGGEGHGVRGARIGIGDHARAAARFFEQ